MPKFEYSYQTFSIQGNVGDQLNIWGEEGWRVVDFKTKGAWNWILLERRYQDTLAPSGPGIFDQKRVYERGAPISAPVESK
jgi:hypothetical protein